jgi:hypothetical protein
MPIGKIGQKGESDMRQFIRHPSDVPIDFKLCGADFGNQELLKNYSDGGLCFISDTWVEPDSEIQITIPVTNHDFQATASVVWCKFIDGNYEVGIRFLEAEAEHAVRIIEQIYLIERYKEDKLSREGRRLSGEEAAREWISQYAGEFPE